MTCATSMCKSFILVSTRSQFAKTHGCKHIPHAVWRHVSELTCNPSISWWTTARGSWSIGKPGRRDKSLQTLRSLQGSQGLGSWFEFRRGLEGAPTLLRSRGVSSKSRAIFLVQRWMVGSFHGITSPLTKRVQLEHGDKAPCSGQAVIIDFSIMGMSENGVYPQWKPYYTIYILY